MLSQWRVMQYSCVHTHFICCCSREGAVTIQNKTHHVSGRRCDFIVKGWLRQTKLPWLKLSLLDRSAVWSMLVPLPQHPWGLHGRQGFQVGRWRWSVLVDAFHQALWKVTVSSFIPLRPQLVDVWFLLKSYHLGRKSLICQWMIWTVVFQCGVYSKLSENPAYHQEDNYFSGGLCRLVGILKLYLSPLKHCVL